MNSWWTTKSLLWYSCCKCWTSLRISKRLRNLGSNTLAILAWQPVGRTNGPASGCGSDGLQMWYHQKALSIRLRGSQTTSNTFNSGILANAMRTRRCDHKPGCLKPFSVFSLFHWALNFSTSQTKGRSRSCEKKKSSSSPFRLNSIESSCCNHRPKEVVPQLSIPSVQALCQYQLRHLQNLFEHRNYLPKTLGQVQIFNMSERETHLLSGLKRPAMMKSNWKWDQWESSATASWASEGSGNGIGEPRMAIKYPRSRAKWNQPSRIIRLKKPFYKRYPNICLKERITPSRLQGFAVTREFKASTTTPTQLR